MNSTIGKRVILCSLERVLNDAETQAVRIDTGHWHNMEESIYHQGLPTTYQKDKIIERALWSAASRPSCRMCKVVRDTLIPTWSSLLIIDCKMLSQKNACHASFKSQKASSTNKHNCQTITIPTIPTVIRGQKIGFAILEGIKFQLCFLQKKQVNSVAPSSSVCRDSAWRPS